jgi:hypothetical protein
MSQAPPLVLLEASKSEDLDEIVNVYFSAFKSPIVRLLKPDVPGVRKWFRKGVLRDWESG